MRGNAINKSNNHNNNYYDYKQNKKILIGKVIRNVKITKYIYKIEFKLPVYVSFKPGQFVNILISNNGLDPLLRRPFSVHDYNDNEIFSILYQVVGKATTILSKTNRGNIFNIIGPLGNGFKNLDFKKDNINYVNYKNVLVYIAGGIGIAPILFKAKRDYEYIYKNKLNSLFKMHLYYGVKDLNYFLPFKFYENYFDKIFISFDINDINTEFIKKRKINNKKITFLKGKNIISVFKEYNLYLRSDKRIKNNIYKAYICGPKPMIKSYSKLDNTFETEVSMESYMACGFHVCLGCAIKNKNGEYLYVCDDGPVFNINDIKI